MQYCSLIINSSPLLLDKLKILKKKSDTKHSQGEKPTPMNNKPFYVFSSPPGLLMHTLILFGCNQCVKMLLLFPLNSILPKRSYCMHFIYRAVIFNNYNT